jgi:pentatricopeptide repeat protein
MQPNMYHYERILYAFSEQGDVTQTEIHFQVFARLRLRTQTCVLLTQLFKDAVTAVGYQSAFIVSMITVYGKEGNMEKMEYYFNIAEKHRLLTDVVWLVCSCNCTDFTLMSYSESNPLTDDGELVRAGIPAGQGKGVLRKSKSGRSALITAFASFFFFSLRDNRTWERAAVQYDYVGSRTVERVEDGEVRNAAGLSPGDAGPRRGKFTWFISSLLGGYVYMIAAHDGGDVQGAGRRIPAGSGWTRHAEAAARDAGKKRPHRRGE